MPTFNTPDPDPASALAAWFHQPDRFDPTFPNPDDGVAVVLPNPGVGGTSMIGMLLSGTVRFSARCSGSGSIVYPPGKIVIGSSAPDASIVNGMAFVGIVRPPANKVKAGRPPLMFTSNRNLVVAICGISKPGIDILSSPVVPGPGPV
ncbi:Uncharacterised protein [Mycobacterium tuberculosis]|nr:Uncharacterised protein [Mycobacterium tuberculosis]